MPRSRRKPPVGPDAKAGHGIGQDVHWGRHARRYDELFLDPFSPGVRNPLWSAIERIPPSAVVADLGCGAGALLPTLASRFNQVLAVDFSSVMLAKSKRTIGGKFKNIEYVNLSIAEFAAAAPRVDAAIAVNSLVMPEIDEIDASLRGVRSMLNPAGVFLGIVPAIDAVYYQLMLYTDDALARGMPPRQAERIAAVQADLSGYDFSFGRFKSRGLKQKFWQPFEIEHRLRKAGFASVSLDKVLYPWEESGAAGERFAAEPRTWDWWFEAKG